MTTTFPTAVDTFTTKIDHVTTAAAADIDNLQDAVVAIEKAVFGPFNPKSFGAVGDGIADDSAAFALMATAIQLAGKPAEIVGQGPFLLASTWDASAITVPVTVKVGELVMGNTAGGAGKAIANFNGQSHWKFDHVRLKSAYAGGAWSFVFMGGGTFVDLKFDHCTFMVLGWDGAHIPYIVNMTPTAAGGIQDIDFDTCRFENLAGTFTMNGLLVRGYAGMKVRGCTFVNINNPIVPDNIFAKTDLVYSDNEEIYTGASIFSEGPDIEMTTGITYGGNVQRATVALGNADVGGVLIDFGCSEFAIERNKFLGNPIQLAPTPGNPISHGTIKGNAIKGTRSTSSVNNCIVLQNDAGAASDDITIEGNDCYGTFTGLPIVKGTGYTNVHIRKNPGDDTLEPQSAVVATQQSISTTAYADLATVGPTVTLRVGASGMVRVTLTARLWQDTVGDGAYMGFAASGANVIATADAQSLYTSGQQLSHMSAVFLLTGLTPGSTTFTAKYRSGVVANGANFSDRLMIVEAL